MYRFSKNGISVLVVLDRRRQKNNGLYPVKIEVVYRRTQRYYPTGSDLSENEWACLWKRRRLSPAGASIENSFHIIRDEVEALAEKGRFSFQTLDTRLGVSSSSINAALEKRMQELAKAGRVNSFYRYRSTLRAVERYAGKDIQYQDISPAWLRKCEKCWYENGLGSTSINIYMKTLRCVLRDAMSEDIIKGMQFPFGRGLYEIPSVAGRSLALNKEQIKLVVNYKGDDRKEYYRDLWLFSYLCNGINFRDMLFLQYKNIENGEIAFIRSKTRHSTGQSKVIRAYITPKMTEIINRRGNPFNGNPMTYIFRYAKGGESEFEITRIVRKAIADCNAALKEISEDLGIPAFTTYSARHSFATIMKHGGIDIKYISESLGHTSTSMTEHYIAGFESCDRARYSKILTDF